MIIFLRAYLVLINLFTFAVRGRDKRKARVDQRNRVSEKNLLLLIAIGGGLWALLGMQYFHHKTIKSSFLWKALSLLSIWIILVIVLGLL